MSKRIDWRKAAIAPKPKLSVVDEKEYRENDAAARWLERKELEKSKGKRK